MMQKRHGTCGLAWLAMAGAVLVASAVQAQNLLSDADFARFGYDPAKHQDEWKTRWIPNQIKGPSEWSVDAANGTVTLTGGQTFLHSPWFDVKAGSKLAISIKAEGEGKVSVQFLWWTADGGMADPHQTIPLEPVTPKEGGQTLSAAVDVPAGAAQAYVRIVVEEGSVTVSDPSVSAAK